MSFTVAIIGRPNVGKSTLFNRLAGRPLALVDDMPGITRDRREGEGHIPDRTFRLLDTAPPELSEDKPLQLAIVGRPNVGKSTLVNRLTGEERMLTGPEPGITRDAIAIDWAWHGRQLRLVDTAGLRRRSRIEDRLERLSTADTRRAVGFAATVILVLDAMQPLERQDLTIANMVAEEGRALVLALNKWDAVTEREAVLRW